MNGRKGISSVNKNNIFNPRIISKLKQPKSNLQKYCRWFPASKGLSEIKLGVSGKRHLKYDNRWVNVCV